MTQHYLEVQGFVGFSTQPTMLINTAAAAGVNTAINGGSLKNNLDSATLASVG
ncbi:DUF637 domain-containing protein [Neisseria chenwenguii]|nr:DUF637 domain-containing protein [Neisseria chenwenguii]